MTPGADATLPLRMMKIGIGPKVGVTMWVIGEGRYHPANFPDVTIDDKLLVWDYSQNRSNYQELSRRAMASGNGNGFITEIAHKPSLSLTGAYVLPSGGMPEASRRFARATSTERAASPGARMRAFAMPRSPACGVALHALVAESAVV